MKTPRCYLSVIALVCYTLSSLAQPAEMEQLPPLLEPSGRGTNALMEEAAALQGLLPSAPSAASGTRVRVDAAALAQRQAAITSAQSTRAALRAASEMPERIEVTAEGAVARSGRHQVGFAANSRTAGAVDSVWREAENRRDGAEVW